jgi:hypothetical protein
MVARVPAGSDSQLVVPLLGVDAKAITITEGGAIVFKAGAFVAGVAGMTNGVVDGETIVLSHGSGSYSFVSSS